MKRKLFILAALFAPMLLAAHVKVTVTPESELPTGAPLRSFGQGTWDELVKEDFSAFEKGTEEEPYLDYDLSKYDNGCIDPDMMHGQKWQGSHRVYSAGGVCCMQTTNPMDAARLQSPRGDYSGTLNISFRLKYKDVVFPVDQEGNLARWTGGGVSLELCNDSRKKFDIDPDLQNGSFNGWAMICDFRVYEDQGWCRCEVEFDNYSSYGDSYIDFICSEGCFIDDIQITSSINKFIAQPEVIGVSDVTDTSFTVSFAPTRKAMNYYAYLYTMEGYTDEGEPNYRPVLTAEEMDYLNQNGIDVDAYIDETIEEEGDDRYLMYAMVDDSPNPSVTFEGLNPDTQYYYSIRAHNVTKWSDSKVYRMDEMPTPIAVEATAITEDGFTANWNPTVKGTGYEVDLYGVYPVEEDTEDFVIFHEDFSKVKDYTDAKDEWDAEVLGESNPLGLDDLTTTPGWTGNKNHVTLAGDMLGLDEKGFVLTSPVIYCAGSETVKFRLRLVSTTDTWQTYINFADKPYILSSSDFVDEEEFELPTNGLSETTFKIWGPDNYPVMIDYITMMQDLKAGDNAFVWMGATDTAKENSSLTFSGLDTALFSNYGYAVKAINGEGTSAKRSVGSNRVVVDLANGSGHAGVGVQEIDSNAPAYEVARYTIDGRKINTQATGVNIVRFSDGSVKKVIVK